MPHPKTDPSLGSRSPEALLRGTAEGLFTTLALVCLTALAILALRPYALGSEILRSALLCTVLTVSATGAVGAFLATLVFGRRRWSAASGAIGASLSLTIALWAWSGWDGQLVSGFLATGPVLSFQRLYGTLRTIGALLAGGVGGAVVGMLLHRQPDNRRTWALALPPVGLALALLGGASFAESAPGQRVVLFGMDAVGTEMLERMTNTAELPNLNRLFSEGSVQDLAAEPPYTPPSWTSIATGKLPEGHGIDNWNRIVRSTGKRQNLRRGDVTTASVFEIVESRGLRSMLLDWPVLGRSVPAIENPIDKATVLFLSMGERVPFLFQQAARMTQESRFRVFVSDREKETGLKILTHCAFRRANPDLIGLVIRGTDTMQHYYFHSLEPENFNMDPERAREQADYIPSIYRIVDSMLGEFLDDPYTDVLALSDHGGRAIPIDLPVHFREAYKVRLEPFLSTWGLLVLDDEGKVDLRQSALHECSDRFLRSLLCVNITDTRCQELGRSPDDLLEAGRTDIERAVDLFGSLRFTDNAEQVFPGEYPTRWNGANLRVNLLPVEDGRPPVPFPNFEEHEMELGVGFKVIPFQESFWNRQVTDGEHTWDVAEFIETLHWEGTHRIDGLVGAHGPSFATSADLSDARGVDITPTVLHILDLPVAEDMDGRVLTELLAPDSDARQRDPTSVATYDGQVERWSLEGEADYQEKMERELRAVGYID